MIIISKSIKLSEQDIEILKSGQEIVITNANTADGIDEISICIEKEFHKPRCNCDEIRELLIKKVDELNKVEKEIME